MSMMKKMGGRLVALLVMGMAGAAGAAGVEWWAVPAMSEEQRLPDVIPSDGEKGGVVRIVAARNEFEPGSFVLRADRDLGKVRLTLGRFKNEKGQVFPANKLDLKVIKVWYQNKNGWFTYFGDDGDKLCPELLLNDEDLIRVDTKKVANYARLTEKDGRVHEFWLNPPERMNQRFFDFYIGTCAFMPMKQNFKDAKTLQPVTLAKNESKQFFLTVHVTQDIAPGTYHGEIAVGSEAKIPVALRVLDFELPKPMAYRYPDQEFLISSYNYSDPGRIALENGGDGDNWKIFENVLRNMVDHGQTMHWMYGSAVGANGTERTMDTMARVGMRTDVFMGGVSFFGKWHTRDPQLLAVSARLQSDYYDRTRGHHNFYCNYDDEPGARRLKMDREIFDPFRTYGGFKFALAAQNSILWKCGYLFDWHNTATDPMNDEAPAKWNELGDFCHCGWYACNHVGTENPAYNRRQYGLAAYLSGYSAFCNYAHHFGPYNDKSDSFKPMVFAYGCGDGVIDTLGWEGFREGVDDIRYATLLRVLAKTAQATDDVDLRRLGGRANLYLAAFQKCSDDMNMARNEMIRFIEELRAALGPRANVRIEGKKEVPTARKPVPAYPTPAAVVVKNRSQALKLADEWLKCGKIEEAVNVHKQLIHDKAPSWQVGSAIRDIAALYDKWLMPEKAIQWLLANNNRLEAAKYIAGRDEAADKRARELREQVFLDAKESKGVRAEAWAELFGSDFAEAHVDEFITLKGAKQSADFFLSRLTREGGNYSYRGKWELGRKALAWADKAEGTNAQNRAWSCANAYYAAQICNVMGDRKAALDYVERGLRTAVRAAEAAAKDPKKAKPWAPADVYMLEMLKVVLSVQGDQQALTRQFVAADAKLGKGLAIKVRKDKFERIGSIMMCAGDETTVRALDAAYKTFNKPFETKYYTMRYVPGMQLDLGSWPKYAAMAKPETMKLDRPYGGESLQFLETDVTSGERGNVEKDLSKMYARPPQWQGLVDDWGIHFRFEIFDEKAPEFALQLGSAGTLEGYLAPGENTPYVCFLHDLHKTGFGTYNTLYDHARHRRLLKDDPDGRVALQYTDKSVIVYWGVAWDKYATKIPVDGAVWDFEPCLWGRKASCTWNGLKTIHGRSSFGKLRFALPQESRDRVMRRVLSGARSRFESEKVTRGHGPEGLIEHWSDPVVGDAKFYETMLKPMVEQLSEASKKVSPTMDSATIRELEATALPKWHDFRFVVDRLRADYLLRQQAQ